MTLTEKVAYLKGLAAGLDLDKESKEAKIFDAMFDILEDMALTVTDIDEDLSSVEELVDAIDEDLDELEEYVFCAMGFLHIGITVVHWSLSQFS